MPEAVATGNYAEVARQIEQGADPNRAEEVRANLLGSTSVRVTPLQAAVWGRNPRMVTMLMEKTVVTPTTLTVLKCLNDDKGNQEIRDLLDSVPIDTTLACDQVDIPR